MTEMPRYSMRSLLIVLALGPPVLAVWVYLLLLGPASEMVLRRTLSSETFSHYYGGVIYWVRKFPLLVFFLVWYAENWRAVWLVAASVVAFIGWVVVRLNLALNRQQPPIAKGTALV